MLGSRLKHRDRVEEGLGRSLGPKRFRVSLSVKKEIVPKLWGILPQMDVLDHLRAPKMVNIDRDPREKPTLSWKRPTNL